MFAVIALWAVAAVLFLFLGGENTSEEPTGNSGTTETTLQTEPFAFSDLIRIQKVEENACYAAQEIFNDVVISLQENESFVSEN